LRTKVPRARVALDQLLGFEQVERLADRCPRNAAFDSKVIDRGDLGADGPLAGLDPAAEQGRELIVAGDPGAFEIQRFRHGAANGHAAPFADAVSIRLARQDSSSSAGM
jgi:hypothetical protein